MKPGSLLLILQHRVRNWRKRSQNRHRKKEILSVDAPVSGGDIGAKGGTLAIMCGGSDEAFTNAEPVLQNLGDKIKHFGVAGSGKG